MKRDYIKTMSLFVLFLGLTFCFSTLAAFSDTLSVKNHLSFGDVNISMKEFQRKNQEEYPYEDPKTVLPGDTISKIPRITNEAQPCWVRVRVGFCQGEEDFTSLSCQNLCGMDASWVQKGEYYYYTKILEQNESVDVFTGLTIPEHWDSSYAEQEFEMEVRADAIQAENFTPDFSAMSPWGNETIELCVHERSGATICKTENLKLSVRMDEGAGKLLSVPGDFFHNFGTVMPGDEKEDVIALSNETSDPVSLYFYTDTDDRNPEEQAFLQKLKLEITLNETLLYRGNLYSPGLRRPVLLGDFASGETGDLRFQVSIPEELNNDYALRESDVIWVFSASGKEVPASDDPVQPGDGTRADSGAKTGDYLDAKSVWVLLTVSAFMMVAMAILWKGGKGHEK